MAISFARVVELIVDWTHAEIIALEAHLGIHPNRKASTPTQEPASGQETQVEAAVPEASPGPSVERNDAPAEAADHAGATADAETAPGGDTGIEQPGAGHGEAKVATT